MTYANANFPVDQNSGGENWKAETLKFPPMYPKFPPLQAGKEHESRRRRRGRTKMKPRQSGVRQFGQTSLPLSFFSKSRRCCSSPFLDLSYFDCFFEKQTSFSSIGTATKDSSSRTDEACGRFILDDVIFRQFKVSTKGKEQSEITGGGESRGSQLESYTEGGDNSRKRKNPFDSSGLLYS
ncbi:hypothetical protein BHM03_00046953 [Ensete ventricosum]|uniref:Uncharacterized protein n=1 Tax=Ensete ventricosum TaxID=4639 RepID=A0A445ML19_ENSVE|nr:hypothetical protein BHM03_00046953 [Ensete ventricosum]